MDERDMQLERNEELRAPAIDAPVIDLDALQQEGLAALGQRMVGERRFRDGARAFVVLIAADPGNGFYHRAHGVCCEALGVYDFALESLDRAIAIDPRDAYAQACRASIRLRQGDRRGAEQDLRAAEACLDERDVQLRQRVSEMIDRLAA
jgi:tetratricopeptide (TPR) repeat protein